MLLNDLFKIAGEDGNIPQCIAIVAAAGATAKYAVLIPASYTGTESFINPHNVPIIDLRSVSTSTGLGGPLANGGSVAVALKPRIGDGIQFVSQYGSDLNDGLSWGSAKLTIYAAWNALPLVLGNEYAKSGGTIFVGDGVTWGGTVSGQGLRVIGAGDPNWNSGSPTWAGSVVDKPIQIIGVGTGDFTASCDAPVVFITGNATNQPGIWMSGTSIPKVFKSIGATGFQGLTMGVNSTRLD